MVTREGKQRAVATAEQALKQIRGEFPGLKPYLVFSSPHGQALVGNSLAGILLEYPAMCMDTPALGEAKELVRALERLQINPSSSQDPAKDRLRLEHRLAALEPDIVFGDDVQVELRFESLKYEQIFALQSHALVDRERTPQTRASIRIVLGTLKELSERPRG